MDEIVRRLRSAMRQLHQEMETAGTVLPDGELMVTVKDGAVLVNGERVTPEPVIPEPAVIEGEEVSLPAFDDPGDPVTPLGEESEEKKPKGKRK